MSRNISVVVPAVDIADGAPATNITLRLDIGTWFRAAHNWRCPEPPNSSPGSPVAARLAPECGRAETGLRGDRHMTFVSRSVALPAIYRERAVQGA